MPSASDNVKKIGAGEDGELNRTLRLRLRIELAFSHVGLQILSVEK